MNDNALAPFGLSADWINRLRNPENLLKPFEGEREGEREGGRPTGKEEDVERARFRMVFTRIQNFCWPVFAAGNTVWILMFGNHDLRILKTI